MYFRPFFSKPSQVRITCGALTSALLITLNHIRVRPSFYFTQAELLLEVSGVAYVAVNVASALHYVLSILGIHTYTYFAFYTVHIFHSFQQALL